MANDLLTTNLKPLRNFLDRVEGHRRGTRTHLSTGIRWATEGRRNYRGEVVKLRAVRFGARWMTTDEWFDAFLARFIPPDEPSPSSESVPATPAARNRAAASATAQLDSILG